jgi:hypothetical protein
MEQKTAFVAMRFEDDPHKDQTYAVIKDVLQDAGYAPIRADEIKTSGPSVEEIGDYLRAADVVIIDTTSDSPNVAYELGFCHGAGREPDTMLLVRRGDGSDIPFNYRHFRHRCYDNRRQLKRILRDWFGLPTSSRTASDEIE